MKHWRGITVPLIIGIRSWGDRGCLQDWLDGRLVVSPVGAGGASRCRRTPLPALGERKLIPQMGKLAQD